MSSKAMYSYPARLQRRAQQAAVPLTVDIFAWYCEMLTTQPVWFDEARAS